jgi:DNA-binding response OmpR family regulator
MQGKKVLIVDDDARIRTMVGDAFTWAGAQVFLAANGLEAQRQFFENRPDLVILDIMLPDMAGWSAPASWNWPVYRLFFSVLWARKMRPSRG